MTLRWVASVLSDVKDSFRKLRGHSDTKRLIAAMDARIARATDRTQSRVASPMWSRRSASLNSERDNARGWGRLISFKGGCLPRDYPRVVRVGCCAKAHERSEPCSTGCQIDDQQ